MLGFEFAPLRFHDGYPPLEDLALIGDGATAALVARDGSIPWLCLPRFDSEPLFCSILDAERGGSFLVAPEGLVESRQRYEEDTGVVVTELRTRDGVVRLTDGMTLNGASDLVPGSSGGRREIARVVDVLDGRVRLVVDLRPRAGCRAERRSGGWRLRVDSHPDLDLLLWADRELPGLRSEHDLAAGEQLQLRLDWRGGGHRSGRHPTEQLRVTVDAWRRWLDCFAYDGPQEPMVRRSAITLKLCDHVANGAMVAAPTSSIPEAIGGFRNWDYRYSWIRDAAFSVYAMRRIGMTEEAAAFLGWALDAAESHGGPCVLYDIDAQLPKPEREDPDLAGYRGSQPVRWGNGAADQHQHDVFGEIVDCAFQWASGGESLDRHLWERLCAFADQAAERWRTPDHGIWEVRTPGLVYTYSAAMCQVAVDRTATLAERFGLAGDVERWRAEARAITTAILDEAWDDDMGAITEALDAGGRRRGLDASILALPLRRVLPADHPKMVATVDAIVDRLGTGDGLLYRYRHEESPDGIPGGEGAFLLCSFWLVDNLALQGRIDEAVDLYDSLCSRASPTGLLSEQIDPGTGALLGNHPQAFSHIGVISSGVNLARATRGR